MIVPLVLCGGSGTRLWPGSRELYPKQFLKLSGQRSMLQETVERLNGLEDIASPLFICNKEHRFLVAEQVREIGREAKNIILEPAGRGTAPAVAVAVHLVLQELGDKIMLVLPADHVISDLEKFYQALHLGIKAAKNNYLVTFGIVPNKPETGYGYIKRGRSLLDLQEKKEADAVSESNEVFSIHKFVEKPDLETAAQYLASGEYSWNSGMFMFKASAFLKELRDFVPAIAERTEQAFNYSRQESDFLHLQEDSFLASPADTVDYAIMEKTGQGVVIPMQCGWSDVGSWAALWEVEPKDKAGNIVKGDVLSLDVSSSYIQGCNKLIAAIGLQEMVVVDTEDALLVADKNKAQAVKNIVQLLQENNREEAKLHACVYRPWGTYTGLLQGEKFQVKLITVKPGAVLSLQKHFQRAEHWIIVQGKGLVTRDKENFLLHEGESTYIPVESIHRIENPGESTLKFIEVQIGSYLGEDDILRFEDKYGRTE